MKIQVLGPSCANCLKLEMRVMEALIELGIVDAQVEKITVPREIDRLMTGDPPGLVVNDQLVWSGGDELPSKAQLISWLHDATHAPA